MPENFLLFFLLLALTLVGAWYFKKLDGGGIMAAAFVGLCVFTGTGLAGILLMGAFFLLGTMATSWNASRKSRLNAVGQDGSRRTAGQVFANGGVAALVAVIAIFFPAVQAHCLLLVAAAMAAATADTLSSELGIIYGRQCYDVLTLKPAARGADGVISLEGTVIGIAGSLGIALLYAVATRGHSEIVWLLLAGTIGNFTDSVLGATLERGGGLGNNGVNFFCTLAAAAVMVVVLLGR